MQVLGTVLETCILPEIIFLNVTKGPYCWFQDMHGDGSCAPLVVHENHPPASNASSKNRPQNLHKTCTKGINA